MEYISEDFDPQQALFERQKKNTERLLGALASVELGL